MGQTDNLRVRRTEDQLLIAGDSAARLNPWFLIAVIVAVPVFILLAASLIYSSAYGGRIYRGVSAGGIELEGYYPAEARNVLLARLDAYARTPLVLRFTQQEWKATPAEMGMRVDVEDTVNSAYAIGRAGSLLDQWRAQLDAWRHGEAARRPIFRLDAAQRAAFFDQLAKQVDRQPVDARLTLLASELQVRLSPAQGGRTLNVEKTVRRIEEAIAVQSSTTIELAVDDRPPTTVEADLQATRSLAEKMMSAPLVAQFEDQSWKVERADIAELLTFREQPGGQPKVVVEVSEQPLQRLAQRMAKAINRRPFNARFDYAGGNLKVIREGVDGRGLEIPGAIAAIKAHLSSDTRTLTLPVTVTKPAIGSADGAKLAIAGVIEQASTVYGYPGALAERVYNVELASSRLHGVVVAPKETFSFNEEVGAVNKNAGFQWGFGITQQGGNAITVPSVGGGICQVATTLFQPVFWAGYDVGTRVPHLYWIPRYGVAPKGLKGLDTTVDQIYDKDGNLSYAVDFTFKNNSPYPMLIQSRTNGTNLTFALLGTKPAWQVKVDGPVIENVVPKLTDPRTEENPDWPVGKRVFIEEAREGFKATIVRTVSQDGKVIDQHRFVSEYQPTRDVTMVGTKKETPTQPTPAPAPTPNPTPARR